jgi:hypothetical protein
MLKNKKAVHPVVSVALLLVVAVISVVGFQSWFSSFSTGVLVSVEQDTNNQIPSDIYVEDLTTNKIYIKSHSGSSTIHGIEILSSNQTQMCINSTSFKVISGLTTIDVSSCSLIRAQVYEILITANNQLLEYVTIAK